MLELRIFFCLKITEWKYEMYIYENMKYNWGQLLFSCFRKSFFVGTYFYQDYQ